MCYHMTRKPISVVKNVLHRNCSLLEMPDHIKMSLHGEDDPTWCDYPPFGKLIFGHLNIYVVCLACLRARDHLVKHLLCRRTIE